MKHKNDNKFGDVRENKRLYTHFVLVISFIFISCNEYLPLRDDPTNYMTISSSQSYVFPIVRTQRITPIEGYIDFYFKIKNNYDESLEDIALFDGKIEIEWIAGPEKIPQAPIR